MRVNLRPVVVDVLLAAALTGLTVATMVNRPEIGADWVAYVLATLTAAPIALRQWAPVATMLVIVGAAAAYSLLGYGDFPNGGIGVLVGMFTVATLRPRPVAAATWLTIVAVLAISLATTKQNIAWPEIVTEILVALVAWALGESTRRWGQRTERLAQDAVRAVAQERVRIARELHDIVAHHMAVISLQAGVARYVLDSDLPTARDAITAVGDSSREALVEMRRLLDVLRVDPDGEPDFSPQPGLTVLGELVDRTRGAGLPVDLVVTGQTRALPPGPDLCAYRVAQESLTNVLKHAGPAVAKVELDYGERMLTLKVSDNGAGLLKSHAHHESSASHGIRGMRERAELYGGVLTAGPAEDGGFAVLVRLPMSEAR